MTDPFAILIQKLGQELNVSLHVDHHNSCMLQFHQKLTIQLQMDQSKENLLMAAFIIEIPPGKFRENIFCEALKANNLPDPRVGILGYVPLSNQLTLHQSYPLSYIETVHLAPLIAGFIDYSQLWREAIEKGQSSPTIISSSSSNPFGLK